MLIYLAQLTHEKTNVFQNRCFPLAVGFIAEYLKEIFGSRITVEVFKAPKDLNQALLKKIPDIFMLSNYLWNTNLSCAFAKKVRERNENVLILMGGPNISSDHQKRQLFLRQNPAIDVYILKEGERVAVDLVEKFIETKSRSAVKELKHFSTVSVIDGQLCENEADESDRIGLSGRNGTLSDIPSPYLSGLFDKFFIDGAVPIIETNRGCPFSCSYCQQGGKYFNKIAHFPPEQIGEEVLYIARKMNKENVQSYAIEIADANFGMYDRDLLISEAIRKAQDNYGFPKVVGCSTGKNRIDSIVKNINFLQPGTITLRSALQSTNPRTLRAINRVNIRFETYLKIREEMDNLGLKNNCDLMLGLPLESLESHCQGIYSLIDWVDEFTCLQSIILNGSEMERADYRERYALATRFRVIPECLGEYSIFDEETKVLETEEIIIQTNTMSFKDYLQCRKLHFLLMVYHNTGLNSIIYDFFKHLNFPKSQLMKELFTLDSSPLQNVIDGFLEDTKRELFTTAEEITKIENPEDLTYNKIFKYLSIAFFLNKNLVVETLSSALKNTLGPTYDSEISEIAGIIGEMIIVPSGESVSKVINFKSKQLKEIFGSSVRLFHSQEQLSKLKILNNMYKEPSDKINKMVYHLRPVNLCLRYEYDIADLMKIQAL